MLVDFFREEIGSRSISLLDLPNYQNPGDQLIWEGEEVILKQLNILVNYRSSLDFFDRNMVSASDCILLHGGGNFGDIYYKHQKFREMIIQFFPWNKIIICPSTVFFKSKNNLLNSVEIFSKHNDLVICARDKESYAVLEKNFVSNKLFLLPDTAHAINLEKEVEKVSINKRLLLYRSDGELGNVRLDELGFIDKIHVSDWPSNNRNNFRLILELASIVINRFIFRLFSFFKIPWRQDDNVNGILKFNSKTDQIDRSINFIKQYSLVITTRLHGFILSYLLDIPCVLLDNSYGKNKNYFNTWFKNEGDCYYVDNVKKVKKILNLHVDRQD